MSARDPRVNPQEGDWLTNGAFDVLIDRIEDDAVCVALFDTKTGIRINPYEPTPFEMYRAKAKRLDILRIPAHLERALAEEKRRRIEAERVCTELQNELNRILALPQTLSTAEVRERLYSSWEAHALHGGAPIESEGSERT